MSKVAVVFWSSSGNTETMAEAVLEASIENYDVMTVQGNCASMAVLSQAGIQETDLLIAATSADEVNLLCCMTAHGMKQGIHTIARILQVQSQHSRDFPE